MTEGIERTANKLIARSIYWTAVQFSSGLGEGENNFARWNDEGGGARAMRWLAATGNKPHSPPVKIFRPSSESNKTRAKAKAKASFE